MPVSPSHFLSFNDSSTWTDFSALMGLADDKMGTAGLSDCTISRHALVSYKIHSFNEVSIKMELQDD